MPERAFEDRSNKHPRARMLIVAVVALAAVGGLVLPWLLTGIATFMIVDDPAAPADVILPLYHEPAVPLAAARLYREGYAKHVVLGDVRPERLETLGLLPLTHDIWRRLLERQGVPADAIIVIGDALTTETDIGRALAAYAASRTHLRVLVVASASFGRLSRDNLQRGLGTAPVTLRMHSVPLTPFSQRNWWTFRQGWVTYFDAYCLWLLHFLR